MQGWPVWLASVTLRDKQYRIRPTETWRPEDFGHAAALLNAVLRDIGDPSRERQFRMCSTLCRHRAVTDFEARRLPEVWYTEPATDIAGGPVELLWERGIPASDSARPCAKPSWRSLDPSDLRLKFPIDCGACPSCVARASCSSRPMRRPA